MSSKKHKPWNQPKPPQPIQTAAAVQVAPVPPVPQTPAAPHPEAVRIRQLIANGKTKVALDSAKDLHKKLRAPESEELLVDAYLARVQALLDQNLEIEAKALMDVVRERVPSAAERLAKISVVAAARNGHLDTLIAPLTDPALAPEKRTEIETWIRTELTSPAALANSSALAPDHPLRQAAAALEQAFSAVTRGPVDDEAMALPEISRRSPLAPWKLLVRAIALFYRREDDACRAALDAIPADAAAARLKPALSAMLGTKPQLTPEASTLVQQVSGNRKELHAALAALDKAFDQGKKSPILSGIRAVMAAAKGSPRELVERIKNHISVRCFLGEIDVDQAIAAMGGQSRHEAYFLRLFALATERVGDLFGPAAAVPAWLSFGGAALAEGWFSENSLEFAAVLLHAAQLVRGMPPEFEANLNRALRGTTFGSVEEIFQQACKIDPDPENFELWLDWAKNRSGHLPAERASKAWRAALPHDARPLMHLAEEAEKRGALKRALDLIEEAGRLDAVNTDVRRAHLRLLVSGAIRHLKQRKSKLAAAEISQIEVRVDAKSGDRPAFVASLRYFNSLVEGNLGAALAERQLMIDLLGNPFAAALVLSSLVHQTGVQKLAAAPPTLVLGKHEIDHMAAGLARGVDLCRDMNLSPTIPTDWLTGLGEQFTERELPTIHALSAAQLRTLVDAALGWARPELGYFITVEGLSRGRSHEARFLIWRAKALPEWAMMRQVQCLDAAYELARREDDKELMQQTVAARSRLRLRARPDPVEANELEEMLEMERRNTSYPSYPDQGNLAEHLSEIEEFDFIDDDDEEDPFGGDIPFNPLEALEHIFGPPPQQRRKRRGGRQGILF